MTEIDVPHWLAWPFKQIGRLFVFGAKKTATVIFMIGLGMCILMFTRILALKIVDKIL